MANMGTYGHIWPSDLQSAIEDILREYGDVVYQATEEGLDAAEETLVACMKEASPIISGEFAKAWKGSGRKYKLSRYAYNPAMVKSKGKRRGRTIPLSNVLEYSTVRGHPFIKKTFDANVNRIAEACVAAIKKEV